MTLKKVHAQLDIKYNRLAKQNLKDILHYADIGHQIRKNDIVITQEQLSLYHKQVKKLKNWIITIIQYIIHFQNKKIILDLGSRNNKKIHIEIKHTGDQYIRHIILSVYSSPPSKGYGEEYTSQPFSFEKEFRLFQDQSRTRPCYPFLSILGSLLSHYDIDVDEEETLFSFLNNDIFNPIVCKDLNQRRPNFRKIDAYRLSANENDFLKCISSVFPVFQTPQNQEMISLQNLRQRFPMIPDFD